MGLQGVYDGSGFTLFRSLFRFHTIFFKNQLFWQCVTGSLYSFISVRNTQTKKKLASFWSGKSSLHFEWKNLSQLDSWLTIWVSDSVNFDRNIPYHGESVTIGFFDVTDDSMNVCEVRLDKLRLEFGNYRHVLVPFLPSVLARGLVLHIWTALLNVLPRFLANSFLGFKFLVFKSGVFA